MRDLTVILPTWAVQKGYKLEGGQGTYDDLYLYKDWEVAKKWDWLEKPPNMLELDRIIVELEDG